MFRSFTVLLVALFFNTAFSQQYRNENISLLGHWDDSTITWASSVANRYSGIWGYAANGKEYAIIGGSNGAHIINITNPAHPTRIQFVPGNMPQCTWREYKTYGHYLYMVSDDNGPNTLQIADLSYLPDSVHIVHNSDTIFKRSHTIFIDDDKLYSGITTFRNAYSPMTIFSLANPERPQLIADLRQSYPDLVSQVHDMYVDNNIIYASCAYDGLKVFKLETDNSLSILGSISQYNFQGYNHSSCLIDSGRHMVMLDEVPDALPCKSIKINDDYTLDIIDTFSTQTGATPHNPFACVNNRVAISYYEDGLQIYDFTNPSNPVRSGYFDTHYQSTPATNTGDYVGAWGAYTKLPSRNIIVSDMQNGLYILNADSALGLEARDSTLLIDTSYVEDTTVTAISAGINFEHILIYPNPTNEYLNISITEDSKVDSWMICDVQGKALYKATQANQAIPVYHLAPGPYYVYIIMPEATVVRRFIKQ